MSVLDSIYGAARTVGGTVTSALGSAGATIGKVATDIETDVARSVIPSTTTVIPYVSAVSNIQPTNSVQVIQPAPYISTPISTVASSQQQNTVESSNLPAPYISSPVISQVTQPTTAKSALTTYVPYGNKAQIELQNTKLIYEPTGQVDIYQPDYHGTWRLISSGGRNALQSGMFTTNAPETSLVYTQQGHGTTLAPTANVSEAAKILANPNRYSSLGSEVYGGYVTPLTGATVQSTGAKLSTYSNQNNLANLVSPTAVNLSKAELPDISAPWNIPSGSPAIQELTSDGLKNNSITYTMPTQVGASVPTKIFSTGEYNGLPVPFVSSLPPTPKSNVGGGTGPIGELYVIPGSLSILNEGSGIAAVPGSYKLETITSKSEPSVMNFISNLGGTLWNEASKWTSIVGLNLPKADTTAGLEKTTYKSSYDINLPTPFVANAPTKPTTEVSYSGGGPEITALGKWIESNRSNLDLTNESAVNQFNINVDKYNALSSANPIIKTTTTTPAYKPSAITFRIENPDTTITEPTVYDSVQKSMVDKISSATPQSVKNWYNAPVEYSGSPFVSKEGTFGILPDYTNAFLKGSVKQLAENPLDTIKTTSEAALILMGVGEIGSAAAPAIASRPILQGMSIATPYAVGGLATFGTAKEATGGFKDYSPSASKRAGEIFSESWLPFIIGGSLYSKAVDLDTYGKSINIGDGARRIYETTNFPNTPDIGDIGGALKITASDTLFSLRQRAAGQVNLGPESGLRYEYNIKNSGDLISQPGSLRDLQNKGVAFNVPSESEIIRLNRADVETSNIFNAKTEGGIGKNIVEEKKITPQKGSLAYLQEQGVAFNVPSSEDIIRLNRADIETNKIFNIKTEGGETKLPPSEVVTLTPQKGSLKYLQEKGVAFNVPSAEDIIKLKRSEALTEGIFNAKTEGGNLPPTTVLPELLTPQKGSFNWLKEQGIIPTKETGPLETPEARGLSNYLGKYYEDLVKEVKGAGFNPETPDILSSLRAATKVEELRLKKMSGFDRADILKNYESMISGGSFGKVEKFTPQVGSLTYLKEKGVISSKETGPEVTTSKQELTDYLAKLHENLISEIKSAGLDPLSPSVKSQIDAELKIRQESIKKLNTIARSDLFSGRKSLDELLSNSENVINTRRVIINKKTWTDKELAERLKPRRWPSKSEGGKGVESGKGGQVLVQKLAQKAEQTLKQEAKQEMKQEAKQEKKKKSLSISEETYRNYPALYNVRDYDMANAELTKEYGLQSISSPRQPVSEMQSMVSKITPFISFQQKPFSISEQSRQQVGESKVSLASDSVSKKVQDIISGIKLGSISGMTPLQKEIQKTSQEQITGQMQKSIIAQAPILKIDIVQTPDILQIPDITQTPRQKQEQKITTDLTTETKITKIVIPPILPQLLGGSIPPGSGGGGHNKRFKRHEQLFSYDFDPWKAARITAKVLAVGSNVTRGPGSSLPTFSLQPPKLLQKPVKVTPRVAPKVLLPKFNVPMQKVPTQQRKVSIQQFAIPKINTPKSTNTLKSMSLSSSLSQKKKGKK